MQQGDAREQVGAGPDYASSDAVGQNARHVAPVREVWRTRCACCASMAKMLHHTGLHQAAHEFRHPECGALRIDDRVEFKLNDARGMSSPHWMPVADAPTGILSVFRLDDDSRVTPMYLGAG